MRLLLLQHVLQPVNQLNRNYTIPPPDYIQPLVLSASLIRVPHNGSFTPFLQPLLLVLPLLLIVHFVSPACPKVIPTFSLLWVFIQAPRRLPSHLALSLCNKPPLFMLLPCHRYPYPDLSFVTGNSRGCRQKYIKPAAPPMDLCVRHQEWQEFSPAASPTPQVRFGNVYYHCNILCIQACCSQFRAEMVTIPATIATKLLPIHSEYLADHMGHM